MRLAIDVDNTVLDWQYTWADEYQLWFDEWLDPVKLGEWGAALTATHFDTWDEFWDWFNTAKVWDKMDPVPGAFGALHAFKAHKIPFLFCTARPDSGRATAYDLAHQWGTVVDFRNDQSKHLSRADLWIDDSPGALQNLADNGKPAIKLVRPWNVGAPATFEAATWPEIVNIIMEENL
jgi:hypothetical protein